MPSIFLSAFFASLDGLFQYLGVMRAPSGGRSGLGEVISIMGNFNYPGDSSRIFFPCVHSDRPTALADPACPCHLLYRVRLRNGPACAANGNPGQADFRRGGISSCLGNLSTDRADATKPCLASRAVISPRVDLSR